jgi:hypothetical protein
MSLTHFDSRDAKAAGGRKSVFDSLISAEELL